MILRRIDFGSVFVASGALNFFGEGWKFHKLFKKFFGLNFRGATFVSKTTTLNYRKGNLELDANLQPKLLFPNCVRVYPIKGVVLNSIGLSGLGAEHLFAQGLWQERTEPFFVSFMAVGATKKERVEEAKKFAEIFARELPKFRAKIGMEVNISCPNTSHETSELVDGAVDQLKEFGNLGIPIVLKINVLTPVEAVVRIADSGLCDAITVSNTIPWGQLPEIIDWQKIFGTMESPLNHFGGGGLSGYPLLPIVGRWILEARGNGVTIPIIGGGGILKEDDVDFLYDCGANAVAIGSVAILRPWRVQGIIKRAKQIF